MNQGEKEFIWLKETISVIKKILIFFPGDQGYQEGPPVSRYIFHNHAIYLYGDDFFTVSIFYFGVEKLLN